MTGPLSPSQYMSGAVKHRTSYNRRRTTANKAIKLNDIVDIMYSSGLLKILYKAPDVATDRMLLDRVVRR